MVIIQDVNRRATRPTSTTNSLFALFIISTIKTGSISPPHTTGKQVRLCAQKNHAFAWFLKVRPTGIELVSSAPQADTLSIELWALKSDFVSRINYYLIILTFLFVVFNGFYKNLFLRRKSIYLLYHFSFRINTPNCYNNSMNEAKTGTYVYDKKLGKVVKVSDRVPSVKKSAGHICGGCCGCCHGNND